MSRLEAFIRDASFDGTSENANRIKALEQEIFKLRSQSTDDNKFSQTALVGNLPPSISMRDAELWLKEKMQSVCSIVPEIYCKGIFKGIMFMKFPSQHVRDQCVVAFAKAQLYHGENRVWISLSKRVCSIQSSSKSKKCWLIGNLLVQVSGWMNRHAH